MFARVRWSALSSCRKVPRDIFSVFFLGAIFSVSDIIPCVAGYTRPVWASLRVGVPMIAVAFVRRFAAKQPHRVEGGVRVVSLPAVGPLRDCDEEGQVACVLILVRAWWIDVRKEGPSHWGCSPNLPEHNFSAFSSQAWRSEPSEPHGEALP